MQDETLKRVKVKALQMMQTLGMSESILLLIERRGRADLLIFGFLACVTLAVIYALVYWVKPLF